MTDASETFAAMLRKTAHDCADMYFVEVAGVPEAAPDAYWEQSWSAAMEGVTTGARTLCASLGFDPEMTEAVVSAAIIFFLERFDRVNTGWGPGGRA